MTEHTATTTVVVKMPTEDYFTRDSGPYVAALSLAAEYDGVKTGGGSDLTTGMSDLDIEVPTANAARMVLAMKAVGLACRALPPQAD